MIKDLIKIKKTLYDAIESCGIDPVKQSELPELKLEQNLRVTDQVIRKDRNVTIIQSQQVNVQIIRNVLNACIAIDDLMINILEHHKTDTLIDSLSIAMEEAGVSAHDFNRALIGKLARSALKRHPSQKEAAKSMGFKGHSGLAPYLRRGDIEDERG